MGLFALVALFGVIVIDMDRQEGRIDTIRFAFAMNISFASDLVQTW